MLLIGLIVFALSLLIDRNQTDGKYKKALIRAGMVSYLFLILAVTLIERTPTGNHQAKWIPFWSWFQVFTGQRTLWYLEEISLNILLFIPFGCLLRLNCKISAVTALIIGFALSAAIEITQFTLCLGLFEWDDMIHNSIGCMIGTVIVTAIQRKICIREE